MKKPDRMLVFDALYALAAQDGREEALFGKSLGAARAAYERTLIGKEYPSVILEFPLAGSPGFDLLTGYTRVEPGERFAPGAGYGRQDLFDWFSRVSPRFPDVGCGFEIDTSSGGGDRAGVYLQHFGHRELAAPFLQSIAEEARAPLLEAVADRMPEGWPPAYMGLFPGRPGAPMRIGGYMGEKELRRCAEDPAHLKKCLGQIGYRDDDLGMPERCARLMRLVPGVDFQFDILPDGSLGDTFGLSLSFNRIRPREFRECMETGYGREVMELLQEWGLADERWRRIADAVFARVVDYDREDGSAGRFALCVLPNYAKVRFRKGLPRDAKFYLTCRGREL